MIWLYILLVLLIILITSKAKSIQLFLEERKRKNELGEKIFGSPAALPIIGNIHQLPHNSFAHADFLIERSHEAKRNGAHLRRAWLFNKLLVFPIDAESIKVALEDTVEIKKGMDYDFYQQWLGDGLLLSHDDRWRSQRKMLTPTFHFSMLDSYTEIFNRQSKVLLEKMEEKRLAAGNDAIVDVYPLVTNCTLDIIAEATMGVRLGIQLQEDHSYGEAVKKFNYFAYLMAINPIYWIRSLWYLFGYGRETDRIIGVLKGLSNKVIEERSKAIKDRQKKSHGNGLEHDKESSNYFPQKRRKAFLDLLLEMQDENRLSTEDVRQQVDTFMFAGHDTTAQAISWTIWCLASHPEIQERAFQEIYEFFGDESDDLDREFDTADLNNLKYLDQCVKESMRIFPPVPIVERTLRNDMKICEKIVPKGTTLIISPLIIHHNYKVYPEHDVYNPDNFLPENVATRHAYDYIPFSAGLRNCIGQKFAMLEIKVVLVHILRRFRLTTNIDFHANGRGVETVLRPQLGIPVFIQTRVK